MNKVEEKLKSGRAKKVDGNIFSEEPMRKLQTPAVKKDVTSLCSGMTGSYAPTPFCCE